MGKKKNKKSFLKKQLKPFLNSNKVILAALTGAATGIAIAGLLGTEKAKELVHTVEDSMNNFAQKVKGEVSKVTGDASKNSYKTSEEPKVKSAASA